MTSSIDQHGALRWAWIFAISLLIHLLSLTLIPFPKSDHDFALPEPIELVSIDPALLEDRPEGKIVDVDQPETKEVPEDARFLAERNTRVKEEMVALRQTQNPGGQAAPRAADVPKQEAPPQVERFTLEEEGLKKNEERSAAPPLEQRGEAGSREAFLREVDRAGSQTLLNTREFMYAGYYNRIRRKVSTTWAPQSTISVEELRGADEIAAIVSIVIDTQGRVERVDLVRSSGFRRYDQEAVRAIEDASPFPNPPQGLMDPNGKVRIPQWSFILFTTRWTWQIYQ